MSFLTHNLNCIYISNSETASRIFKVMANYGFLDLPAEVRVMIYRLVLGDKRHYINLAHARSKDICALCFRNHTNGAACKKPRPSAWDKNAGVYKGRGALGALLLTCRSINLELAPMWFDTVHFLIRTYFGFDVCRFATETSPRSSVHDSMIRQLHYLTLNLDLQMAGVETDQSFKIPSTFIDKCCKLRTLALQIENPWPGHVDFRQLSAGTVTRSAVQVMIGFAHLHGPLEYCTQGWRGIVWDDTGEHNAAFLSLRADYGQEPNFTLVPNGMFGNEYYRGHLTEILPRELLHVSSKSGRFDSK